MPSIQIKRILCPTDFSEPSGHALRYAFMVAQRYGATLSLVHVIEPLSPVPGLALDTKIALEERPNLLDRVQTLLEESVPEDMEGKIEIKTVVRRGASFFEIIQAAREEETDLIVIATEGHTGLSHLLLGSTTERVVRKAPCPVLSFRQPEDPTLMDIKKILFPTDFSDFAEYALDYAVALAQDFNAELYMFYVEAGLPYIPDEADLDFPTQEEIEQHAKQQMTAQIEKRAGITARRFVGRGMPSEEICDFAKAHEIDLVVMATHGHTGLKHMLLGSTTERVVRLAPCPVLSIHHPEHEFVMP